MSVTQPTYDETEMDALDGTTDPETGVYYIPWLYPANGTPPVKVLHTQQQKHLLNLLRMIAPGVVINRNDGLNVCVLGIPRYRIGGTSYTLPDDNVFACSDDSTCYLYCDADQVVEESTTGWPVTDHIKLAVVTTASGEVAAVKPALLENHTIGIDNDWSAIAAGQEVDMAGYSLGDLGALKWERVDATISGGVLAVGNDIGAVRVKGEGSAADDIDSITSNTDNEVRLLLLSRYNNTTGNITVKDAEYLHLAAERDCILAADHDWILLGKVCYLAGPGKDVWAELTRNNSDYRVWDGVIEGGGNALYDVGVTEYQTEDIDLTVPGALILNDMTCVAVKPYTGGAQNLNGIDLGEGAWADVLHDGLLVLRPYNSTASPITVKHNGGAGTVDVFLQNGVEFVMNDDSCRLVLMYDAGQGAFVEVSRSPMTLAHLEATEYCMPYPVSFNVPGALSAKVYEQEILLPVSGKIRTATGRVTTAPSGGLCYVDVQLDSGGGFGSIFEAGDANKIAIADGEYEDTATVIDPWCSFSAGDRLRIEVVATGSSPNSAADLRVMVDARCAVQAPE